MRRSITALSCFCRVVEPAELMHKTGKFLATLWTDESGISSVEYALLLSFVALMILGAGFVLSDAVTAAMQDAASWFD